MAASPSNTLDSPYPYFGGKSRIIAQVWERFGTVRNFVDPFFGSGASILGRPEPFDGNETINDIDGYLANFWRAVKVNPELTAFFADWPINENDLTARHLWLVQRKDRLGPQLEADPDWCDIKVAGWWVWGMACWIGSGFCSGQGPWHPVKNEDGTKTLQKAGNTGRGVQRQLVHLGDAGQGVQRKMVGIYDWFAMLQERFRRVRVCCGDWKRVLTPSVTTVHGTTAVFLDPPYSAEADRHDGCYRCDDLTVAHEVREWALAHGSDPLFRIALCGYEGEHEMPESWECLEWKTKGGMARGLNSQGQKNKIRERVWFSPHCLKPEKDRYPLFDCLGDDEETVHHVETEQDA